jgi:hypothetical protein
MLETKISIDKKIQEIRLEVMLNSLKTTNGITELHQLLQILCLDFDLETDIEEKHLQEMANEATKNKRSMLEILINEDDIEVFVE